MTARFSALRAGRTLHPGFFIFIDIVPASGDSEDDFGEADGMLIGRGNRSPRRKTCPSATFFLY
jgi:hypothetical protein